eukprot:TRINITY_DN204019_c0_g1_i1.p2 TRINITY_DN204019_c0_g1~~TRINITY_DN204019_c0_g1_i1.p2  ORF type:complete len:136 (+),score=4.88 TRINITY_DN204019_c0_g1_i1:41-409(+)
MANNEEERRQNTRVDAELSCHFSSVNKTCKARTLNLSMSGVLVKMEEEMPKVEMGDIVECQFTIYESLFVLSGEVRRVAKEELALHFSTLNPQKQAVLNTIIETHSEQTSLHYVMSRLLFGH